jgi:cytidylate kinase
VPAKGTGEYLVAGEAAGKRNGENCLVGRDQIARRALQEQTQTVLLGRFACHAPKQPMKLKAGLAGAPRQRRKRHIAVRLAIQVMYVKQQFSIRRHGVES